MGAREPSDQDVYDRLAVAWFVGGAPCVVRKRMWVRAVPIQIRKFGLSSFADFKRLASDPKNAWSCFSAGVLAINLDYCASLIFKFGEEPDSTDVAASLSFLRKNARSSIGLLVRGNEVAVVTAYWYAGQTDLTRERVRALRAALADR